MPLFKTAAASLFRAEIDVSERRHSYTRELLAKLRRLIGKGFSRQAQCVIVLSCRSMIYFSISILSLSSCPTTLF